MKIDEHIKYWLDSAAHDLDVAEHLFQSGKYDWSLFIGHLVLEKTLKALFVFKNNNQAPPKIHNLVRLADLSGLVLTMEQKMLFDKITDFNIDTRYPSVKFEFYKQCTAQFTQEYFAAIKENYTWLKSLIK